MLKTYEKFLIKNFINKFILISLIFFSLVVILSILEEISFFKNNDANFLYPYFLTLLGAPITWVVQALVLALFTKSETVSLLAATTLLATATTAPRAWVPTSLLTPLLPSSSIRVNCSMEASWLRLVMQSTVVLVSPWPWMMVAPPTLRATASLLLGCLRMLVSSLQSAPASPPSMLTTPATKSRVGT